MNPEDFLRIINKGDAATSFRLGSIPADYASGSPAVLFDGETVAGTRLYPCMSSYKPKANDRVIVAMVGHGGVVMGRVDGGSNPWIAATLTNGWVNYDDGSYWNTTAYMRDANGFVHLRGLIKSGTLLNAAFILPAGFRPYRDSIFACVAGVNDLGRCDVRANGFVVPATGNTTYFSLEGISFLAEN